MHTGIYTQTHTCMHTCIYTHTNRHTCMYTHMCLYTYTHKHTYALMHARTHTKIRTNTHVCTRVYTHVHACTHLYTHVHTCTCTHTHIHTVNMSYMISGLQVRPCYTAWTHTLFFPSPTGKGPACSFSDLQSPPRARKGSRLSRGLKGNNHLSLLLPCGEIFFQKPPGFSTLYKIILRSDCSAGSHRAYYILGLYG